MVSLTAPDKVVSQGAEIRLVSELDREGLERLRRVVLSAVEAAVYKTLYAVPQGGEQGGYGQGGGHHRELGLLAGQRTEERLEEDDANEVDAREHRC